MQLRDRVVALKTFSDKIVTAFERAVAGGGRGRAKTGGLKVTEQ